MQKLKLLVLTDHKNHSKENSLYALVQAMHHHPRCAQVDVATRANEMNDLFFKKFISKGLYVAKADESFAFSPVGKSFKKNLRREVVRNYDAIWLRMPPPLSRDFLKFLETEFATQLIINDPRGIYETGSKEFLMNFSELCPPMQVCRTIEDIADFKSRFPIVLKPFREYGGRGITRIEGEKVWIGKKETDFDTFIEEIKNTNFEYLAVKFLKNVSKGDKRIVVVDGKIMGASLRLPAKDSWLCNVAMGGTSNHTIVDKAEIEIVEKINPVLSEMGIVMYGVDTLMGDNGKRVLSEINTTSIGGLPQIAKMTGKPLLKEAAGLIWNNIAESILN